MRLLYNKINSGEFIPADPKNLHKANKEKFGNVWLYTNQKMSYEINSEGFRAPEFNTVDWKNTVAVFGCSFIFGTGLSKHSTIPTFLQPKTKYNVINLGVEGLSNYGILYNLIQFKKKYNPKVCLVLWTDSSRITYHTKQEDYHITAWEAQTGEFKEHVPDIDYSYILSEDIQHKDLLYQDVADMIPGVYTSHRSEIETLKLFQEHFSIKDTNKLDMQLVNRYLARDIGWSKSNECWFAHPGLELSQKYADKMWNNLPKLVKMDLKL